MARAGLNGLLSYTVSGTLHTYRVRVGDIGHGTAMVFAEDQARTTRSFYPHRTASQRFSIQVLLKDWHERADFISWLAGYAQQALDPNASRVVFPFMSVAVPDRKFAQRGLPKAGYEWGAHTGMMAFSPVIEFEPGLSPGQPNASVTVSRIFNEAGAYASGPAVKYFYPFSTQLQASQVPEDYGTITPPPANIVPSTAGSADVGGA